jgi:putative oxidoreductase
MNHKYNCAFWIGWPLCAIHFIQKYCEPFLGLFFRIWIGVIFYKSGMVSIESWSSTLDLFNYEYDVPLLPPELAAYLSTAVEIVCSILLFLGLATRAAAVPLLVMTLVIEFTYMDLVNHYYWMMLMVYMIVIGPGAISADYFIKKWAMKKCDNAG